MTYRSAQSTKHSLTSSAGHMVIFVHGLLARERCEVVRSQMLSTVLSAQLRRSSPCALNYVHLGMISLFPGLASIVLPRLTVNICNWFFPSCMR